MELKIFNEKKNKVHGKNKLLKALIKLDKIK